MVAPLESGVTEMTAPGFMSTEPPSTRTKPFSATLVVEARTPWSMTPPATVLDTEI